MVIGQGTNHDKGSDSSDNNEAKEGATTSHFFLFVVTIVLAVAEFTFEDINKKDGTIVDSQY